MTKTYCDKCKEEIKPGMLTSLYKIEIWESGNYRNDLPYEVCKKCYEEVKNLFDEYAPR